MADAPEVTVHQIPTFSVRCSACGLVSYGVERLRAKLIQHAHQRTHEQAVDSEDTTSG